TVVHPATTGTRRCVTSDDGITAAGEEQNRKQMVSAHVRTLQARRPTSTSAFHTKPPPAECQLSTHCGHSVGPSPLPHGKAQSWRCVLGAARCRALRYRSVSWRLERRAIRRDLQ